MNDLVRHVTPLTRGIIWLAKDVLNSVNPRYQEVDYLLDGLLTANLTTNISASGRVLIGSSFGHPLYIYIASEILPTEVESFLSLLKDLSPENDLLLVDEIDGLNKLKSQLAGLNSHIRIIE